MKRLKRLIRLLIAYGLLCLLITGAWLSIGNSAIADSGLSQLEIESAIAAPLNPSIDLEASDISSEKLIQFAQAYVKVVALIERRENELQSAETESESLRIQRDIESEAFALIEEVGLTRQEYLQLLGLANLDPEFGERIATQIEEVRE